jgi:glycerate dehydrogenase
MKLVVLDGFTVNPGDLSWEPLRSLADCTIYDRTAESEILERAHGAEILFTNKAPLRADTLASLPSLRYIGVLATGYDVVDVESATQRNILVTNVPEYGTYSVAQMVFALLLELTSKVGIHNEAVRQGAWSKSLDWCFWKAPTVELMGKVMGIVGYGRIGKTVGQIALALGMQVIVTSGHRPEVLPPGVRWEPLDELLAQADVVSLHCPLRPSTRGMINAERISRMKPSAFLVNTARGALIVEEDLANALGSGKLAGAAVDVLTAEPPSSTNPLVAAPNCIITPHIAWATKEARTRLLGTAAANLRAWLNGSRQNAVN